jgi:TPR repeat protein
MRLSAANHQPIQPKSSKLIFKVNEMTSVFHRLLPLLVSLVLAAPAAEAAQTVKDQSRAAAAKAKIILPDVRKVALPPSNFPDDLRQAIKDNRWDIAVPQLERMAGDGDPEAKGAYAMTLLRGLGGQQIDTPRARAMLEDAANKGDLVSQRNLAQMLFIGAFNNGVPNYPGAWPMIEKLTQKRDPLGMYLASKYFIEGLLGVRNPPVGMTLLQDAAVGGARNAQYDMALLMRRGIGNEPRPNLPMAAFWFAHAASNAHPLGMYEFGMANLLGIGAKQNVPEGVTWLTRAADTGNSNALVALGVTYMTGQGVAKDTAKAKGYFDKAAAQFNGTAYMMLGKMQVDAAKTPAEKSEILYLLSVADVLGARQGADMATTLRSELSQDAQSAVQKRVVDFRTANKISSVPRISQNVE